MHLPVRLVSVIAAKVDIINNILINVLRTVDMSQIIFSMRYMLYAMK